MNTTLDTSIPVIAFRRSFGLSALFVSLTMFSTRKKIEVKMHIEMIPDAAVLDFTAISACAFSKLSISFELCATISEPDS